MQRPFPRPQKRWNPRPTGSTLRDAGFFFSGLGVFFFGLSRLAGVFF